MNFVFVTMVIEYKEWFFILRCLTKSQKGDRMKKLLGSLLAILALAAVDASARHCGRGGCGPRAACDRGCPVEVVEAERPQCCQLMEVPVCPEKHVEITYTCPDNTLAPGTAGAHFPLNGSNNGSTQRNVKYNEYRK